MTDLFAVDSDGLVVAKLHQNNDGTAWVELTRIAYALRSFRSGLYINRELAEKAIRTEYRECEEVTFIDAPPIPKETND